MVSLINVSRLYGDIMAVQGITFRMERGEFVYLIGQSGAGKTTVLRLIHHAIFPSVGTVAVDRFRSDSIRASKIPELRRHIGFVYQDFRLIGDRSVYENIALVLRVAGAPRRRIHRRVKEVLAEVGLLGRIRDSADTLSGGEMQRVSIARALVNRPFLLLADEPTGNLDPENAAGITRVLERVNIGGTAVLIATHNQDLARASGHRIIRLEKGCLAPEPSPRETRRFVPPETNPDR